MKERIEGEFNEAESEEINRSRISSVCATTLSSASSIRDDEAREDEFQLLERLPMFTRPRTTSFHLHGDGPLHGPQREEGGESMVNMTKLGATERKLFIDNLIKHIEKDNLRLLQNQKKRIDRVNVKLPTIEVRYTNLFVEAECQVVQGKPLPTLWNSFMSKVSVLAKLLGLNQNEAKICILRDISGIIKPARMTLLLGPPGCGKSTLLQVLAGKHEKSLKVMGEVSYNGYKFNEFVPEKTSAYISQYDLHIPEMTVREILDFSARFQGVGSRAGIMREVIRREKEQSITPDPEIDAYMKAISLEGLERSLHTDYIMKIMGLDRCADTIVGDVMRRGISGGEKKRLTTGEMIIGPSKALFMDEISTGLDSSTTYQIITCLQQFAHITESTVVVSLLQPAPETYNLFDDVILMAEGKIVYHGPKEEILNFFEECGFKCPERKGDAEFLQEVLSKKDQEQYWHHMVDNYNYITINQFVEKFRAHHIGKDLSAQLSIDYEKSHCHKNALSFSVHSLSKWELLKACIARELLLMRRNSFTYIFKSTQVGLLALITGTIFLRTRMRVDTLHANYYLGSLFFALNFQMVIALPELAMTVTRLPIFFKQRDMYFYPAWAYTISAILLKIPVSLLITVVWTCITYYLIGFSFEAGRFFRHLLLLICVNTMSLSLFRCIASYCQMVVASTVGGSLVWAVFLLFGGFIIPLPSMPRWLKWGFWISPFSYSEIALAVNEFLAPRWQNKVQSTNITIGTQTLISRGLNYPSYYYWIGVGALIGFTFLFDIGFTLALTFTRSYGASRAIISQEKLAQLQGHEPEIQHKIEHNIATKNAEKMVLPFIPLTVSFKDLSYYIDTPKGMREQQHGKRRQLLRNITGSFRPGVLSALMGVTGAGKTTLLDVLSGRKTGGYIEGQIRIGGYPRVQQSFARISGYCEQTDIHSPQVTVEESLVFSAWLRLPTEISLEIRHDFVNEVLETIELDKIRDEIVGIPGKTGLSTEQRKRLTIAVELVSNPSVIFMDEPTSGLDARAAAIVMRAVKNVAKTGRTVVCTIHQPSIDIFEAFDELILMKRGGELIYSGSLGRHSYKVIEYFESIHGVPPIKSNYNPATWMLEVTSASVEAQLEIDFAKIFKDSYLHEENNMLVEQLSKPLSGSSDLYFDTQYPQNFWVQFKACLWKQSLSYWRSPQYNLVRIMFMLLSSIVIGLLFWKHGGNIKNQQDLFNILGCIYVSTLFTGINNCSSTIPFISVERVVVYRENFAGMYSPRAYSLAQVIMEIPYVFIQVLLFMVTAYPAIGFAMTATKFVWFFYARFCTLLYFVYLGMMLTAMTPTMHLALILQSVFYQFQILFSGFIVPRPQIPAWWVWFYDTCPFSWTLDGLFASQYGDVQTEIMVFGERKSISLFLEDYFGFRHDRLALVGALLAFYPVIFAGLFAYFTEKMNFQRR